MLGQEGDIEDADLVLSSMHVQSADVAAFVFDDQELSVCVMVLKMEMLSVELHPQKTGLVVFRPNHASHFFFACVRVDFEQEWQIVVGDRAQSYHRWHSIKVFSCTGEATADRQTTMLCHAQQNAAISGIFCKL